MGSGRALLAARVLVAGLFAVLTAVQIVRTAIVADETRGDPRRISAVWPDHPDSLAKSALLGVADSAVRRRPLDTETISKADELARKAPLAAEPFLIKGAVLQQKGEFAEAERLLVEARLRDPRNPGGRYLLASNYLTTGKILPALHEMVALTGLVNRPYSDISSALASYARTPGAVANLRRIFRENPQLEAMVLSQLSEDPANAGLILSLFARRNGVSGAPQAWQGQLLTKLVDNGEYERAHATWRALTGFSEAHSIFNPQFAKIEAPPPFNWTFLESGAGTVEAEDGTLNVIYFGRADAVLASQVLQLASGKYQIASKISGEFGSPQSLRWIMYCLPKREALLDFPLVRTGSYIMQFQVPPAGCDAQQLQLKGESKDLDARANVRLAGLQLRQVQ